MIKIQELTKHQLEGLDEKFIEYQSVDNDIAAREFQIRHPWKQTDENIGGGRAATTADGEQRLLETIEADKRITYLRRLKTACAAAVSRMDKSTLEVYKTRYCSPGKYDWSELPKIMHYERTWVYRRRYAILALLAKELGMLT